MLRLQMLALVALAVLATSSPAAAQPATVQAPAGSPSPAAVQSALRFLDTMAIERTARAAMEAMTGALMTGISKRFEAEHGEPFPADLGVEFHTILSSFLQRRFVEQLPAIRQRSALIYAAHFSAAELDRLTALMDDPAMRKLTRLQPVILPQLARVSEFTDEDRRELEQLVKGAVEQWAAKQPKPDSRS